MAIVENRDYELLVKSVLEAEYKVKLITDSTVSSGGATYSYDLANIEQEVYVEIKHRHASQDRGGILQSIQGRFSVVFNGDKSQLFILVFSKEISQKDKNYYVGSFKLGNGVGKLKVLDRNEIMLLAEKHNKLQDTKFSKRIKTDPENVEASIDILKTKYNQDIIRLAFNKNHYSEKNTELVKSSEFYFQKARDLLKELRIYDDLQGFLDEKDIKRAMDRKSSYQQLKINWENRGNTKPSEFINYLQEYQQDLIPLFNLISKFISYIDQKGWNRQVFNEYKDKRCIARTGVNQSIMVKHFLEFAINGFEIVPEHRNYVFSRVIEYLRNPKDKFNILSDGHRELISKYFLGNIYKDDDFHKKLKTHFNQYELSVVNLENLTCFYTVIIYDESIRGLWETTKLKTGYAGGSGKPPIDNNVEDDNEGEDNENDKIPIHLDQVENIDRLNRQPIAKSIARLLNKQIFSTSIKKPWYIRWFINSLVYLKKDNVWLKKKKEEIEEEKISRHSFMIHLQGAWGDGKSTFLNLIENNLNNGDNKWVVVKFNAWQHQHLNPPWWPFLDQIYEQSKNKVGVLNGPLLRIREKYRRTLSVKLTNKLITLNIILFLSWLFLEWFPVLIQFAKVGTSTKSDSLSSNLVYLSTLIGTLSVIVVAFISISKLFIKIFLLKSSETAKSFMERANDPMMKIKEHFQDLVDDIETSGYRLAVFIDDLDRCNSTFAVELLEGIQTLYKDRKVLYIVAGDKKWISTCFENHYDKFNSIVTEPKQKLGYLFIEKAFQLSIRLPKISEIVISDYWEFILSGKREKPKKQLQDDKRDEIILELSEKLDVFTMKSPTIMKDIREKHNIDSEEATDMLLEAIDNSSNDFDHLFRYNYKLLKGNPRSIKRLANQYNIASNTLLAEFREFDKIKLFRWLILQNDYPVFTDWIEENIDLDDLEDEIEEKWKSLLKDITWVALFKDKIGGHGGALTIKDIKNLLGK